MTGGARRRAPAIRAAQVHFRLAAGFAEAAQAAFDVGAPAVGVEASLAEIRAASLGCPCVACSLTAIEHPLGAAARKCTRPISWRRRATGSSSSISTPPMSASSMRN